LPLNRNAMLPLTGARAGTRGRVSRTTESDNSFCLAKKSKTSRRPANDWYLYTPPLACKGFNEGCGAQQESMT